MHFHTDSYVELNFHVNILDRNIRNGEATSEEMIASVRSFDRRLVDLENSLDWIAQTRPAYLVRLNGSFDRLRESVAEFSERTGNKIVFDDLIDPQRISALTVDGAKNYRSQRKQSLKPNVG